jgi:hypothetical protein
MDTRFFDIWNEPIFKNDCFSNLRDFEAAPMSHSNLILRSFCISAELVRQLHNTGLANELK